MVGRMEGYEKINRVYSPEGIAPCLTSRDYKDPPRILIEVDVSEDEEVMPG